MMIISTLIFLFGADFPICTAVYDQRYPEVCFVNNQYYIFWGDWREYSTNYCIYGARVSVDGTVLDPNGKKIWGSEAANKVKVAYDGTNFLVIFREGC